MYVHLIAIEFRVLSRSFPRDYYLMRYTANNKPKQIEKSTKLKRKSLKMKASLHTLYSFFSLFPIRYRMEMEHNNFMCI